MLAALVVTTNLISLALLVNMLVSSTDTEGSSLLLAALQVWATNVIAFALITNSSAFSPTDTMPLTSRSKILMGVQATAALQTLLDAPDLAAQLGAAAHQRVLDEYLGDRHLTQYVDLFESLIGR